MYTGSDDKRILCFGDSNAWGISPYLNEKYAVPDILLVSPIHLHSDIGVLEGSGYDYGKEEYEKSTQLAGYLSDVALTHDCGFLDAAAHAKASSIDGMHMEADQHALLAKALTDKIETMRRE